MTSFNPKPLTEKQAHDLTQALRQSTALFLLDYDGTHAPFVQDPKKAAAEPKAKEYLLKLQKAFPDSFVFITGRPVAELDMLMELETLQDGTVKKGQTLDVKFNVAGEHGADMRLGDTRTQLLQLSREQVDFLDNARTKSEQFAKQVIQENQLNEGDVFIETKQRSFAIHWRPVHDKNNALANTIEEKANRFLADIAAQQDNPTVTLDLADGDPQKVKSFVEHPGDCNCEFKLNSALVSKGIIAQKIIERPEYAKKTHIVFIGDDFPGTDGYASEVVNSLTGSKQGISIQVLTNPDKYIEDGPKAPHFTLASPAALGDFWASVFEQVTMPL